ncbi:uncharacterized protein N0V89_007882 [Didymosphaeria variabile]|uniref:NADAR domain-containing protein n=1 Tax=Didymosphaeria variabile TaxID=1932322 RepID=A0A9W8XM00_9PLEO|nr:uncharacterized protein N0V89_007882 [Didymosphaeria variabile]KAJ4352533.1 hypothetical protein N0V89_007882 [Didymosphaeria variabile]
MAAEGPVFFWKETEAETGFLSPWYKTRFKEGHQHYQSAGHMVLGEKAKLFGDTVITRPIYRMQTADKKQEAFERIIAAETIDEQIRSADGIQGYDEQVWLEILIVNAIPDALPICEHANLLKFIFSYEYWDVRDPLLALGTRELVYACPTDRILGIGFGPEEARSTVREQWGRNIFARGVDIARSKA